MERIISTLISSEGSSFSFRGRLSTAEGSWKHFDVKVYGNAAVVAGYQEGSVNLSSVQGTRRVSEFWINQGEWKRVHRHVSL